MITLATSVACIGHLIVVAPPQDDCRQWLREHVVELESIDPAEPAIDDLMPVLNAIGKHRIVALSGGGSADQGASYAAMGRVIRAMHGRRRFERLVWSAGLFEADDMHRQLVAEAPSSDVARTLFAVWRTNREIRGLLDYARQTHDGDRPLQMLGSLGQFHAVGKALYPAHVIALFDSVDATLLTQRQRDDLERIFVGVQRLSRAPQAIRDEGTTLVATIIERFQANRAAFDRTLGVERAAMEGRMLDNLRTFIDLEHIRAGTSDNPKTAEAFRNDVQRENLAWLINEQFPSRRLILWPGHESMLDVTDEDVYVLGFTSYSGTVGRSNQTRRSALAPPPPDSLESLLHGLGVKIGFVDLSAVQSDPDHFLRKCPAKQAFSDALPTEERFDVLDGLIFIDEMTPSTRVD